MRKIGLLINPHAKKARRNPSLIQNLIQNFPHSNAIWMPKNHEDLNRITQQILNDKFEVIFLSGGDGTFRATVESFLSHKSTQPLPAFVLLQGGTGCLYSKHYYGAQHPVRHLKSTLKRLDGSKDLILTPLNILEVNGHYGFIFAVGGFANVLGYYMSHKERSIALANWILFRIAISFLLGTSLYKRMFPRFSLALQQNGKERFMDITAICCSSLSVGYGMNPFYEIEVNRNFVGLIFFKSPYRIFRYVSKLLQRQPIKTDDVEQFKGESIDLFLTHPLQPMVDGDMLEPATQINVRLGPQVNLFV
jgi:diacylglycerol kinase family enzyme